jgi:transglutaminase-like putative cysteine protease
MALLQRIHSLPRDTRDTLFLLAVIAWTVAPQAENLPVWCSIMTALLLLWRGAIAVRSEPLPSRWWLVGLLLLAIAATLLSFRTLLGRDAGVTFIVVLLALKTLEMRARRDAFVIFFLGFFTLLSNFFFSQSLLTAAAMLVSLLGLLTALVNSHMPVGRPPLLHAARTAGWMALLGAPIMVVLFMLFPRMAPLWGVPSDAMNGRSGLSPNMQVGSIAKLALDGSVAMRVRFDGTPPPQHSMYYRGPVLSSFDGRQWTPLRSAFNPELQVQANLQVSGASFTYAVTLQPNSQPWILLLDAAPEKPTLTGLNATMQPGLQWLADRPVNTLMRYKAQSYPTFSHGPLKPVVGLQDFLDLPAGFNPRTLQLAADMRRSPPLAQAQAPQLVQAVLERLRTGGYSYTLEPGVFGIHTADEFWFDRKVGFCEHIASSFVLLMRALDVPARVVTGYQGGELNVVDGFWTVRQSDAHAWAEVWMAGKGWVRVDPTSAVAPGRTGSLERLEPPSNAFAQALITVSPAMALNLRAVWDAANNRWNQWVLNYSQDKQFELLKNLGFTSPSWQDLSYLLIGIVVIVSLCGAAWTLWERQRQDPWLRLLQAAAHKLQRAGLAIPTQATARQMAEMIKSYNAAVQYADSPLTAWLLKMEQWRYSPHRASALADLRREFKHLQWPTPKNSPR